MQRLVLIIEEQPDIVSNGGSLPPDDPLVIACRDAFASLSPIYQSQWHRQPRLREILKTLLIIINMFIHYFVLDADLEIYVEEIRVE